MKELEERLLSGEIISVSQSGLRDIELRMKLRLLTKTLVGIEELYRYKGKSFFGRKLSRRDEGVGFSIQASSWDYIK
jgi:hypothetical protein